MRRGSRREFMSDGSKNLGLYERIILTDEKPYQDIEYRIKEIVHKRPSTNDSCSPLMQMKHYKCGDFGLVDKNACVYQESLNQDSKSSKFLRNDFYVISNPFL